MLPGLVSGPHIQHNPLFPNGLDGIMAYIKQAGSIPCEVKRIAIDGDAGLHTRASLELGRQGNCWRRHLSLRRRRQDCRALGCPSTRPGFLQQLQHDVLRRILWLPASPPSCAAFDNTVEQSVRSSLILTPPFTVAAPTFPACGAIRLVGMPRERCRERRLRRSALPVHPERRGRPTRRPPLQLRHRHRLLTEPQTA
jgi:hypothetical protein